MAYIIVDGVLYHHGIKGQRWGVRRFQNKDGSLTNKGKKRYNESNESSLSDEDVRRIVEETRRQDRNRKIVKAVVGTTIAAASIYGLYKLGTTEKGKEIAGKLVDKVKDKAVEEITSQATKGKEAVKKAGMDALMSYGQAVDKGMATAKTAAVDGLMSYGQAVDKGIATAKTAAVDGLMSYGQAVDKGMATAKTAAVDGLMSYGQAVDKGIATAKTAAVDGLMSYGQAVDKGMATAKTAAVDGLMSYGQAVDKGIAAAKEARRNISKSSAARTYVKAVDRGMSAVKSNGMKALMNYGQTVDGLLKRR